MMSHVQLPSGVTEADVHATIATPDVSYGDRRSDYRLHRKGSLWVSAFGRHPVHVTVREPT